MKLSTHVVRMRGTYVQGQRSVENGENYLRFSHLEA